MVTEVTFSSDLLSAHCFQTAKIICSLCKEIAVVIARTAGAGGAGADGAGRLARGAVGALRRALRRRVRLHGALLTRRARPVVTRDAYCAHSKHI